MWSFSIWKVYFVLSHLKCKAVAQMWWIEQVIDPFFWLKNLKCNFIYRKVILAFKKEKRLKSRNSFNPILEKVRLDLHDTGGQINDNNCEIFRGIMFLCSMNCRYIKCYHQFYEHSINIIFCLNCCFMPLHLPSICTTCSIDYLLLGANTATNSPFLTKLLSDASPKRPALKTHSL